MEIWNFRNDTIHKPINLHELEGKQLLEGNIIQEWERGLGGLPTLEFSHLFCLKRWDLIVKSLEGKKDWMATLKLDMELHNDQLLDPDEFETNDALWHWIGLPRQKNEEIEAKKKKRQNNRNTRTIWDTLLSQSGICTLYKLDVYIFT